MARLHFLNLLAFGSLLHTLPDCIFLPVIRVMSMMEFSGS